jgi:UDP-perosamine 4-acetyltransferase
MKALIVGAGAQGRVILDILRAQGTYASIGFVEEDPDLLGKTLNGALIECGLPQALQNLRGVELIVALGNPLRRAALSASIRASGGVLLNAIHPSAVIMPTASLGSGIMIGATAVVNSNARIHNDVIVNTGAVIEHDCVVGEAAGIAPGAQLGGRVTVGTRGFVGTGAIVLSRLQIGADTIVGAGAVVTKSLPDRVLAFGVPARVQKALKEDFDWSAVL